ncbi:MAG: hypothetical protein JWM80_1685 [Cyanobacteria bacterium RYN_339]|nr:hypothetical protein [Cyanobacteria bacterium RYN_339]
MRLRYLTFLILLASCRTVAGQPPAQVEVIAQSPRPIVASLAPLEEPGMHPYRAPDFAELPAEAEGGRWERIIPGSQPLASPTPTPIPTPTPLPGEGYGPPYIYLSGSGVSLQVGETVQLPSAGPGITWGVLEGEHATVTADGRLTGSLPGAVHVYAQSGSRRKYLLAAIVDPATRVRQAIAQTTGNDGEYSGDWATVLRSDADWRAFQMARLSGASPVPVDFTKESLIAFHVNTTQEGFEAGPVVTSIRGSVVEAVMPNMPPEVCSCDPTVRVVVAAVPLLPPDARVVLVRTNSSTKLAPVPVTGPTPTPPPPPTPTPDPFNNLPAGSPSHPPGPPYPPGPFPPPGGCPDPVFAQGDRVPPFDLTWYDEPMSGPSSWEPVLPPGGSLRLFARRASAEIRWQVSDPRIASVSASGELLALHGGVALVSASTSEGLLRALIPVMDMPAPAARFHFRADWNIPNTAVAQGPRIIRDAAGWEQLWRSDLLYQLPWAPPPVDFTRYDVVALVDARTTYSEAQPVITQITQDARTVHVAFPGVENRGLGSHRTIYLFLVGKLAADVTVRVHTLCDP